MSGMISRAERISIFTEFANALRISGYDQKFRSEIIGGVFKRIKEIEHEIEQGQRQRYRNREEIESAKAKRLGKHLNTWFLDGITVNTLKVMATPKSGLKNVIQKSQNNMGTWADRGRTKVIEMGGNPITKGLNKPEEFSGPGSCHMA